VAVAFLAHPNCHSRGPVCFLFPGPRANGDRHPFPGSSCSPPAGQMRPLGPGCSMFVPGQWPASWQTQGPVSLAVSFARPLGWAVPLEWIVAGLGVDVIRITRAFPQKARTVRMQGP
jgi:hypothetical protein